MKIFKADLLHDAGGFALRQRLDRANAEDLFSFRFKGLHRALGILGRNNDDHADAIIEDAVHLVTVDVALFLEPLKDGRTRPGLSVDAALSAFGQNAGHVFDEAAARDVGHALDFHLLHDIEDLLHVDAGRSHGAVGERRAVKGHIPVGLGDFNHLAKEREAVRVRAA